jgi:hypothetical protein
LALNPRNENKRLEICSCASRVAGQNQKGDVVLRNTLGRMTYQEMANQIISLQIYRRGIGVPQSLATDRQRGALRIV